MDGRRNGQTHDERVVTIVAALGVMVIVFALVVVGGWALARLLDVDLAHNAVLVGAGLVCACAVALWCGIRFIVRANRS